MSCDIKWNFDKKLMESWSKELLDDALNSGSKSNFLTSKITINDLNFGNIAPEVEILEIGDIANDKFRGIFKIKYYGDSFIELKTSIQANLLNVYIKNSKQELNGDFTLPNFKLAKESFSIPLIIKLSDIQLSGIIIVVFSKLKGLTLVFKNDPLENINVNSSFQNVEIIENFLQKKIEIQIRDLFRDVLPSVLNKLSQKYTTSNLINQLYQQRKNSEINDNSNNGNIDNKRILLSEINPMEPELSPANMLRLSTLIKSRQSFGLNILPMNDVIQRQNLHKFTNQNEIFKKKINISYLNKFINNNSNMNNILIQISKIQSNFYLNENKRDNLKKRKIKLNNKRQKENDKMESIDLKSNDSSKTLIDEEQLKSNEIKIIQPSTNKSHSIESQTMDLNYKPILHFYNRPNSPSTTTSTKSHKFTNIGLGYNWMDSPPPPYQQL
ncbi:hypothetical protein WICMUC_000151 [Wickerhamomyces mucosus]|uniref:Mitochondrial distribution and morphology protein 34 n=1 Tax=Wickerhamomyces mucosus TaxID=1378264 RepID=A0A9P8Q058_9ASCO|nr:hypothetical protein WICMUC_000151 [Wickerhamomyces mucosus]